MIKVWSNIGNYYTPRCAHRRIIPYLCSPRYMFCYFPLFLLNSIVIITARFYYVPTRAVDVVIPFPLYSYSKNPLYSYSRYFIFCMRDNVIYIYIYIYIYISSIRVMHIQEWRVSFEKRSKTKEIAMLFSFHNTRQPLNNF